MISGGGHQKPVIFLHGVMVAIDVCLYDRMGWNTVETQVPSCFPEGFGWMKHFVKCGCAVQGWIRLKNKKGSLALRFQQLQSQSCQCLAPGPLWEPRLWQKWQPELQWLWLWWLYLRLPKMLDCRVPKVVTEGSLHRRNTWGIPTVINKPRSTLLSLLWHWVYVTILTLSGILSVIIGHCRSVDPMSDYCV